MTPTEMWEGCGILFHTYVWGMNYVDQNVCPEALLPLDNFLFQSLHFCLTTPRTKDKLLYEVTPDALTVPRGGQAQQDILGTDGADPPRDNKEKLRDLSGSKSDGRKTMHTPVTEKGLCWIPRSGG